jgi:hypothetical protein
MRVSCIRHRYQNGESGRPQGGRRRAALAKPATIALGRRGVPCARRHFRLQDEASAKGSLWEDAEQGQGRRNGQQQRQHDPSRGHQDHLPRVTVRPSRRVVSMLSPSRGCAVLSADRSQPCLRRHHDEHRCVQHHLVARLPQYHATRPARPAGPDEDEITSMLFHGPENLLRGPPLTPLVDILDTLGPGERRSLVQDLLRVRRTSASMLAVKTRPQKESRRRFARGV